MLKFYWSLKGDFEQSSLKFHLTRKVLKFEICWKIDIAPELGRTYFVKEMDEACVRDRNRKEREWQRQKG